MDSRTAFDMVYDNMSAAFGFDRSFAMNQFCSKYGTDSVPVIDAVADCPQYQSEFVQAVNSIIGGAAPRKHKAKLPPANDKVHSVITQLILKYGDKSVNFARTYGKVYSMMASRREWAVILADSGCRTKKQVLLKDPERFDQFVKCVNELMNEEE